MDERNPWSEKQVAKSQAKKNRELDALIAECVRNSKARRRNKQEHAKWRGQYADATALSQSPLQARPEAFGVCADNSIDKSRWQQTYDGDMAIREAEAQREVDRKRLRVAPAYNKGGYQYITNPKDVTTTHKKAET